MELGSVLTSTVAAVVIAAICCRNSADCLITANEFHQKYLSFAIKVQSTTIHLFVSSPPASLVQFHSTEYRAHEEESSQKTTKT
jgi:hypothetical protein